MMNTNWNGLMKVLEIKHLDVDGKVLWEADNLINMLHAEGEAFILKTMFTGEETVPVNYYLGLDNRSSLSRSDTLSTVIITEPSTTNGYLRSALPSSGSFTVALDSSGNVYEASGPIAAFSATGGNWGPVTNLFLTTTAGTSGSLISSVPLSSSINVTDGQTINLRISLTLRDCSTC